MCRNIICVHFWLKNVSASLTASAHRHNQLEQLETRGLLVRFEGLWVITFALPYHLTFLLLGLFSAWSKLKCPEEEGKRNVERI